MVECRILERLIIEAFFADTCTLWTHSEYKLQTIVRIFSKASHFFGLTISLSKAEVMHKPGLGSVPHNINIDDTQLKSVNNFKYLESIISSDGTLKKK